MNNPGAKEENNIYYDECVILKSSPYGESDRLVTVFSKNLGKKNLLAKGACKPGSKLCGFTDSLSVLNYAPKATRTFTLITQPKIVSPLFHIKEMGASFYKAYAMCELVSRAAEFDNKMPEIYDALKNSLIIMDLMTSDDEAASEKVLIKFELFFLEYAGFSLNFENCCHCGKTLSGEFIYDSGAGGITCARCALGRREAEVAQDAAGLIKKITKETDLKKIIGENYSINTLGAALALVKKHIKANLNIVLTSADIA
ncbi:MAG: DNA repair protein RecO [uncultured bacterium]|uniref:DNA repair protein RecO n=1 Tax=Candidatus Wallbacteria bacterium GWC2_49_35 TaxID=1817813 RepID=A0A1F7X0D3_9BACT|nr:MAG: DNA repair protein RecO [uncultured bacterium]OGM08564.1 MAG: DNA repair protein RecO [Candidatus Wallbacteria bacterium GWC2_49_35]HBC76874.1 DNA repair protein RecO [Candidatus Wallbacteria bacterium]